MASVHDVAAAILKRTGEIDTYKLQKLVYYCQAWHLVWDSESLFNERIEAWANGPVVPALYKEHRGQYKISTWSKGNPKHLSSSETETVQAIVDHYGKKSGYWLSQLTHRELPWREARQGLSVNDRGQREIKKATLLEYYGGLVDAGEEID